MKHPYAEILIAIAEGKEIQWQDSDGVWLNEPVSCVLMEIYSPEYSPQRYRIKPATITINGVDCEAPLTGAEGSSHWIKIQTFTKDLFMHFNSDEARDAAYAALIKPFESTP